MIWCSSSSTGAEPRTPRTERVGFERRPATGFSLVEALVAIGIVGLLLGLLIPTLAGARAASRTVVCQSNLRQMAVAARQYTTIHDRWPLAIDFQRRDEGLVQVAWDWVSSFGADEPISPGPLWAFAGDPHEVMQCPEYHGDANFSGDPFTGYNYNTTYIGGEEAFAVSGQGPIRAGVRPHACRRSTRCAIFGDGGSAAGANKFMRAPLYRESSDGFNIGLEAIYSGGQAFRHVDSSVAAYVDGHVGVVQEPRRGELATDALLEGFLGYPRNGFLSEDDDAYDPR